jgi:hypothetical protein
MTNGTGGAPIDGAGDYRPVADYSGILTHPNLIINRSPSFPELIKGAQQLFGSYEAFSKKLGIVKSRLSFYAAGKHDTDVQTKQVISDSVMKRTEELASMLTSGGLEHRGREIDIVRRIMGVSVNDLAARVQRQPSAIRNYQQNTHLTDEMFGKTLTVLLTDGQGRDENRHALGVEDKVYREATTKMPSAITVAEYGQRTGDYVGLVRALTYALIEAADGLKGPDKADERQKLAQVLPKGDVGLLTMSMRAMLEGGDPYQRFVLNNPQLRLDGNPGDLEILVSGRDNDA